MANFFNELLGSKPTVPTLPPIDLGTEQQKAIGANQAALPGAEKLVGQANQFSRDEITKMLESVIPGYSNMVASATGNIASELKGEIPTDVSQAVQDSAAARAFGGGYAGSGAHGDLVARDLGLTSLALTERGLSSFENWMKTSASLYEPSMINVSSMFISPAQQASFDVEERNAQFQRQWMQNQIAAQPAMWAQDLKEAVETAISIYSHSGAGIQHAGTIPVQGSGIENTGDTGNFNYGPGDVQGAGQGTGEGGFGGGSVDFGGEMGI